MQHGGISSCMTEFEGVQFDTVSDVGNLQTGPRAVGRGRQQVPEPAQRGLQGARGRRGGSEAGVTSRVFQLAVRHAALSRVRRAGSQRGELPGAAEHGQRYNPLV